MLRFWCWMSRSPGGLDPSAVLALRRVLRYLTDRGDVTVLMASQVPEIVEDLAHQIAVLNGTRLIAYGSIDALRQKTGCPGSLPEIFEKLVHPETLESIEK